MVRTGERTYTGRHRQRATWRKDFQKEWKRCAAAEISDPKNASYNPRPYHWVCGCPSFVKSRFLICKHLIQKVHPVNSAFFRQVSRERTFPIWRHRDLRPIDPPADDDLKGIPESTVTMPSAGLGGGKGIEGDSDDSDSSDSGNEENLGRDAGDGVIAGSEVDEDEEELEIQLQEMKN